MKHFDFMLELAKENEKFFKNFLKYAKVIKRIAKKELKDLRVFVFGSIAEGKILPTSDIDILIVSKNMPKKKLVRGAR